MLERLGEKLRIIEEWSENEENEIMKRTEKNRKEFLFLLSKHEDASIKIGCIGIRVASLDEQ